MFKELLPIVKGRPLTITVVAMDGGQIRLNVIPHELEKDGEVNSKITHSMRDEVAAVPDTAIKALTTPLSICGTAEELDADLPALLVKFVGQHATLQQSIDQATREIEQAVQAVAERKKQDSKGKAKKDEKKDQGGGAGDEKDKGKNDEQASLLTEWCAPPAQAPATATQAAEGGGN